MVDDIKQPKGRNWTRIALIVSLILNLAFVGVMAGAAAGRTKYKDRDDRSDRRVLEQLGPYGKALPDDARRAIAVQLRPERGDISRTRRDLKRAFDEIVTLLKAEPFDQAAFAASLAAQQRMIADRVEAGQGALVAHIASMTPQQRRDYADMLQRTLRRGPGSKPKP